MRSLISGIACLLLSTQLVLAQQVGDKVMPREPTRLRVEMEAIASVTQFDQLQIEQISQDAAWLWVRTPQGTRGWIRREDVLPVASNALAASPQPQTTAAPGTTFFIGWLGAAHIALLHDHLGTLAQLRELKPEDVAPLQARLKSVREQVRLLAKQVETRLATEQAGPGMTMTRLQLTQLLAAIENEVNALDNLVSFPTAEARAAFNEARRVAEQTFQLLSRPPEISSEPSL